MAKFKKGDWVRATVSDGVIKSGDIGLVAEKSTVPYVDWMGKKRWAYVERELEPWRPKVGERVSVTYGHGWDGEGVVKGIGRRIYTITMTSGNSAGASGGFAVDEIKPASTPAPLRIVEGRFYKTRDGRKVGPAKSVRYSSKYPWSLGQAWIYCNDGVCGDGSHPSYDLIAEWVDEPAAQPTIANDNAEPAKPKFKVGDLVRALEDSGGGSVRKGVAYDVTDVNDDEIRFRKPDGTIDGWGAKFFELVTTTKSTPAIVALIEGGTAKPATHPKVHADQASATAEAERLALVHPGQKFGVFVLADSKIAERYEETVWATRLIA